MRIKTSEQEVHEVGLAQATERQDLLPRQRGRRHVIQVANGYPLLALARQQDGLLYVLVQEGEHFAEYFSRNDLRIALRYSGQHRSIHDKSWTIPLIATEEIEPT